MSKKLIAGAGVVASFAIALAPLATFAEGELNLKQIDNLEVTITKSCEFGHTFTDTTLSSGNLDPVTHTDGGAAWDNPGVQSFSVVGSDTFKTGEDTATETMEAGTVDSAFATTVFKIYCNSKRGYTLTAVGENLTSTDSNHPIVAAASASDVTGAWAADNTSKWSWKPSLTATSNAALASGITANTELAAPASASTILSGSSATGNAGDVLTVVYSVGLVNDQDAGTYTGAMTYVLAENPAS